MAKFDVDNEPFNSKEEAQAVNRKKKAISSKVKPQKPIDKGKIIVFSIIGLFAVCIVGIMAYSLSGEEKDKQVTEITTPESEADKYNSKLQAIEGDDRQDDTRKVELTETFKNDSKENESDIQQIKLEEQIKNMENGSNGRQDTKSSSPSREQNYSNSAPKRTNNYSGRSNEVAYRSSSNSRSNTVNSNTSEEEEVPIKKNTSPKEEPYKSSNSSNGFFKNNKKSNTNAEEIILYACIHTNQEILNNQRVKFRTTKEFTYDNKTYPVNTIIYGTSEIKPNRLNVNINKINQENIKLEVYDSEDSELGIYVLTPNLNAELSKQLKKEGIEDDDLSKIPFSKTLKSIFNSKVKEEKVQLLNNYKVIIKIKKNV